MQSLLLLIPATAKILLVLFFSFFLKDASVAWHFLTAIIIIGTATRSRLSTGSIIWVWLAGKCKPGLWTGLDWTMIMDSYLDWWCRVL